MTTYTKEILSGSTDGRPTKVVATSTPGTTIHTAHATSEDEIWLWVNNVDTVSRNLTIEFGGTTSPDDLIVVGVPANEGLVVVIPGLILTNSLVVKAFGSAANVLNITGFVNRIT